ncbi:MAG: bifunctional proline dehydrogenase/L-glutamate gamma-semialdehyde dehydrogenase PutA [Candidatus Reddybacter sp.]
MSYLVPPRAPAQARQRIVQALYQDEGGFVASLVALTSMDKATNDGIEMRARALIDSMGRTGLLQRRTLMAAMLEQFPLSSPAGIQLMGLAEALLRVPDARTADALIADKLAGGDWGSHLSSQQPLWLNGVLLGLMLAHRVAVFTRHGVSRSYGWHLPSELLRALQRQIMTQGIIWFGGRFVFASNVEAALTRAAGLADRGYSVSYDMLGEGARCARDAARYMQRYRQMIGALADAKRAGSRQDEANSFSLSANISVKLSALHPRYEPAQRQRVMAELVPRLLSLALLARSSRVSLTIDAEESWRLDLSLDVFEAVYCNPALAGWEGFGLALQAYQPRALSVLDWLRDLATVEGRRIPLRLVKGAYWDSEIKACQQGGYEAYPVLTRKASTDLNYQACAHFLLRHRAYFYPQFASHNPYTVATVLEFDRQLALDGGTACQGYEFQRLHGMGEALFEQLRDQGLRCRVYAPVGEQSDLLSYLVRRMLENGANSSVVKHLQQRRSEVSSLVREPRAQVLAWAQVGHPSIALPPDLYGGEGACLIRRNSRGCDLDDQATLQALQAGIADQGRQALWRGEAPLPNQWINAVEIRNPAHCNDILARVELDTATQLQAKIQRVESAFRPWASTSAEQRAHCLRQLADRLESHREQLLDLCTREGGKTLADGISEVREAVDFCRYYAAQAETLFASAQVQPRGVVLCISPWNFPLAIFIGQIAAALACGNTVLAKPAMQSLLMAHCLRDLLVASGLPTDCCQLLLAPGAIVGQQVLPDPRIRAVMFTGSFATGRWLNRALAQRQPCVLIAETGGQNAMLVDATALLEQTVDAIISSAFHSAGQRCSALRVLFVQEDIADDLIVMLSGAMAELRIGDPAQVSSDLGPLIDEQARNKCREHCHYLQGEHRRAHLIYACSLTKDCGGGYFFPPQLYEIGNLGLLTEEVFGPIVHLIRFPAGEIDEVLEQINDSDYGLTLGIQSRIDSRSWQLAQRAQVGNVYINRNMIGAVVGLQPFGGRGLSGTGPKAGGPLYQARLVHWPEGDDSLQKTAFKALDASWAEAWRLREASVPSVFLSADELARSSAFADLCSAQHTWSALAGPNRIHCLGALQWRNGSSTAMQGQLQQTLETLLLVARDLPFTARILAGPTGESNYYQLESRGLILIVVDEASGVVCFLRQLLALLLAGNAALVLCAPDSGFAGFWQALQGALVQTGVPAELFMTANINALVALLDEPLIAAVCLAPGSLLREEITQGLAQRLGAICPLISELNPRVLITALSYEKTISVNTAAVGGNAGLLSLDELD